MSEFVNQNAVGYINNLSENDLDQFIDSSYERYEAMLKESTQNNGAAASVVNDIAKLEQDGLKLDGMMNAQGAFDASTKNLKFNLVLEEQDDEEGDEDEGDEEEGDEDEGDEDEGDEDEGDEEEGDEDEGDEEAGKDDSNKNDKKEDKADADKDDDKKDAKGKGGADDKSKDTEKKPAEKALERAQDPFCQTFLSRCNDDCSASQAE
jgi:hypothetical protein